MKLIGSTPSPYVRRLRLFLGDLDYDFINLDIYSPEGRQELEKFTPAMKVPVLVDDEQYIYDSRVIHRYLSKKQGKSDLSWEQENLMSLIDAANDSYIALLIAGRSGVDIKPDILLVKLQQDRLCRVMPLLEQAAASGQFERWDYPSICLFCLLDWVDFRELESLSTYPHLAQFLASKKQLPLAIATDPRQ